MKAPGEMFEHLSEEQKALFQRVFTFMSNNQKAFKHPEAVLLAPEHWQTTCFNAAYFAAEASGNCGDFVILQDDEIFCREEAQVLQ